MGRAQASAPVGGSRVIVMLSASLAVSTAVGTTGPRPAVTSCGLGIIAVGNEGAGPFGGVGRSRRRFVCGFRRRPTLGMAATSGRSGVGTLRTGSFSMLVASSGGLRTVGAGGLVAARSFLAAACLTTRLEGAIVNGTREAGGRGGVGSSTKGLAMVDEHGTIRGKGRGRPR